MVQFYRGCQKNVPIEDRFSATNPYAAIIFSEHYYDKRYIFFLPYPSAIFDGNDMFGSIGERVVPDFICNS